MIKTDNFKQIEVSSQAELRLWLMENHHQIDSVWLVTFKKSLKDKYVSTDEILDELLCFGWIDGIRRKLDENRTMQLIGPRRQQHWAKSYKDRSVILIEKNLMMPAGFLAIETSKANGLWTFMDDVDALILPDDLLEKLNTNSDAFAFFNAINPSSKRFVLRWLKLAKSSETRSKRIDELFKLSLQGEKLPGS